MEKLSVLSVYYFNLSLLKHTSPEKGNYTKSIKRWELIPITVPTGGNSARQAIDECCVKYCPPKMNRSAWWVFLCFTQNFPTLKALYNCVSVSMCVCGFSQRRFQFHRRHSRDFFFFLPKSFGEGTHASSHRLAHWVTRLIRSIRFYH